ncbi:MAG: DEAD/DEAH box helicase, partial [Bacteroidales bacterium]|nr:DEAD/DEAH box helicase [Bacteroidales bacterium]
LSEFEVEYILNTHDYDPEEVNKIVGLTPEGGKRLQEKYNIEFTPQKIKLIKIVGEMGNSYHCYVQYRQTVSPVLTYIHKNNILNEFKVSDPDEVKVNFPKYDKVATNGRRLKKHQKEGVRFLLANKRCILADSMGTGKTTQLIVSALESHCDRILVVCPASLKTNWKKEISIYDKPENITVVSGTDWGSPTRWKIVNYDILTNFYKVPMEESYSTVKTDNFDGTFTMVRVVDTVTKNGNTKVKMRKSTKKAVIKECMDNSSLYQEGFDCVIIDEAHKLSNKTSMRYKVIDDFLKRGNPQYIFLTTGTPLTNKPINLYWILRLLNADITKDYRYYIKRYCGARTFKLKTGKEITTTGGATHLEELAEKIKHLYIRRLMSDVTDMVSKNITTITYDLSPEQRVVYDRLWNEYMEAQRMMEKPDNEEYRQLVEGIIVRQYLANEMVEHTVELANDLLEEGEKVVVVCTFQEEMQKLKKIYGAKAVLFNGLMNTKQKDKAVESFMNEENVTVFIGQVEAMVGITLTCAHNLVFNSFSWIAASNAQAEDRIYRLTQDVDVNCIYQIFDDDISGHMLGIVQNKVSMADTVIQSKNGK